MTNNQRSISDTQYRDVISRAMIYTCCFFDFGAASIGIALYATILILSVASASSASVRIAKHFSPLILVTLIYTLLSLARVMPHSWTVFYVTEAIPNQTLWVIATPIAAWSAWWYFSNVYSKSPSRELIIILALIAFNTVLSGLVFHNRPFAYGYFGYLWAPMCVLLCALGYNTIVLGDKRATIAATAFIVASLTLADNSQNKLISALFASYLIVRGQPRAIQISGLAATVGLVSFGYYWAWNNPMLAYQLDPNFGIRAQFAKNAYAALTDTNLLGVGFGTEGVKNIYPEVGVKSFQTITSQFVFIGNHNALFDILMRMGAPGLLALVFAFYHYRPSHNDRTILGYQAFLFCAIIINLCVNVALQSAYHAIGIAITLGAIAAQKSVPSRNTDHSRAKKRTFTSQNSEQLVI